MQRKDKIILQKILREIDTADELLGEADYASFESSELLKRAICMTVINIGELVKAISEETRNSNPQIQWRLIAGMRDVTAHKYQTLRMKDVYNVVRIDLPVLRTQLNDMVDMGET